MTILAIVTGLFAIASVLFQIKSHINFKWYYGLGITAVMMILTYEFWKQHRWSVYLYVIGLLINNIKAAFEGTWSFSPQLLVAVAILTILALNYRNLKRASFRSTHSM